MSTIVELFSMPKNKNSTAVGGGTSLGTTTVLLKDKTDIIHPVFELDMQYNGIPDGANIARTNWLYWGHCKRYYWVTNMVFITRDIVEIHCTVDVLASFINGILNSEAYVNYASKSYNALVPDRRLPLQMNTKCSERKVKVTGLDRTGVFILFAASDSVNGKTGFAQGYVLSESTISSLASELLANDFMAKIKDNLYSPLEAIMSCIWLPCSQSLVSSGSTTLKFGDYEGGTYPTAKNTASSETHIVPVLPYKDPITGYYDWRNVAPWTKWHIWLPGVGYQEFPMESCLKGTNATVDITVTCQISCTTGECSYTLECNDEIVMFCKGNMGVELPVAKSGNGVTGAMLSGAGFIGGLGREYTAATVAGSVGGAITAATSAALAGYSFAQHSVSASGAMGGLATPPEMREYIMLYYECPQFPADPFGDLKELIGCPVFKTATLNSYVGGKVFCSNINYNWSGEVFPTDSEYDMLNAFMTSQEGVLLERTV